MSDLAPLDVKQLKTLRIGQTKVRDLSALRGIPLEILLLDETEVTDLSPLLDCPTLNEVTLPAKAPNVEPGVSGARKRVIAL